MNTLLAFRSGNGFLFLLLALAPAWSGCGGSGEVVTSRSMSKAQFLKQANAICGRADNQINAQFERYSRRHLSGGKAPSDLSYARATARIVLPLVEREVAGIRGLRDPTGGERQVAEILDAFEAGIGMGKRNPLTLAGGGRFAFTQAHELSIAFGLVRCAIG